MRKRTLVEADQSLKRMSFEECFEKTAPEAAEAGAEAG